jgi:hypothetical protein
MNTTEQYNDEILVCRDCCEQFVWTAGEHQWFAERALHQPRRCRSCRQARKAERTDYRD